MLQIAYFSAAVGDQSSTAIHEILKVARRDNYRVSITGLLVAGANRYLQVIEGPEQPVRALYARIVRDPRHMAVRRFLHRYVDQRSFGAWSMAFRRHAGEECSTFEELLRGLVANVPDTQLKQQIAFFSRALIENDFGTEARTLGSIRHQRVEGQALRAG